MTIRPSGRTVVPNVPAVPVGVVPVRSHAIQTVGIDAMARCVKDIDLCIAQGATKTFRFFDPDTDLTGAVAITFDVWRDRKSGSQVFTATLAAGTVTVPDPDYFQIAITAATSAAFPKGRHYCEAWVSLVDGNSRLLVGAGRFTVIDTRKHD